MLRHRSDYGRELIELQLCVAPQGALGLIASGICWMVRSRPGLGSNLTGQISIVGSTRTDGHI